MDRDRIITVAAAWAILAVGLLLGLNPAMAVLAGALIAIQQWIAGTRN